MDEGRSQGIRSGIPALSFVVVVGLRLFGLSAGEFPRAVDLKTDGRPAPARVFHPGDPAPKLSWTFQGAPGRTQQAYQVDVLEGSLGGTPESTFTVYGGYNPALMREADVWRADVMDPRHQRPEWIQKNGQANEVPFRLARAAGRSHTYSWRVRLHDGATWGAKGGLTSDGPRTAVRNCSVIGNVRASGADSRFWNCGLEAFPNNCRDLDVGYNAFFNIKGKQMAFFQWAGARRPTPPEEQAVYRDGGHNISADPAFTNAAGHDYCFQVTSAQ